MCIVRAKDHRASRKTHPAPHAHTWLHDGRQKEDCLTSTCAFSSLEAFSAESESRSKAKLVTKASISARRHASAPPPLGSASEPHRATATLLAVEEDAEASEDTDRVDTARCGEKVILTHRHDWVLGSIGKYFKGLLSQS